jgi:hypothetical protein
MTGCRQRGLIFHTSPHGDHEATMKFAILGLLVVLLIGFFVVVWKAAKEWRWFNIVAVCISMLLAIAFLFPAAGALKSRAAWHQIKEKLEVQAAQVQAEYRILKYGDLENPEAGQGIVDLNQRLSKLGIEAGRRWRNLQLRSANPNIVLVSSQQPGDVIPDQAPAEGDDAAAPAAPLPLVPEGLVVYGFAETLNEQQTLIPTIYLGEFRVDSSTPNQVTMTPTGPLEQSQLQAINGRQAGSWTLYELLPLDGHDPFVAEGSSSSDENFFGRIDEELVTKLLENKVTPQTLQSYLRDGERAAEQDPPATRWTKIEFLKNFAIDVDSPDARGALESGFFDGTGRSVDARLQRGEDGQVKFKKGEQIVVKEEAADLLIADGTASLVFEYYLRPLNDYRYILRRIRLRLTELADRMKELEIEKGVLEKSIEKTAAMVVINQDIKNKLEQDLAQFGVEKTAITEYTQKIRQRSEKNRAEMIRLHRQNLQLAQKIEQMHRAIKQRYEQLTPVSTSVSR